MTQTTARQQRVTLSMGQWLRKNRMARGYTLEEVAAAIGRNFRYVSDVELGRRGRNMQPVIGLLWCEYLCVDPNTLFDYLGLGSTDLERFRVQQYLQTGAWAHRLVQGLSHIKQCEQIMEQILKVAPVQGPLKTLCFQLRDEIQGARIALRIPQNPKTR